MRSSRDAADIKLRVELLKNTGADLGRGGGRLWVRVNDSEKARTQYLKSATIEQLIGIDDADMSSAYGKKWRITAFSDDPAAKLGGGFKYRKRGAGCFVSVISDNDEDKESAAPEKDSVVREEDVDKILKQVKAQYDLEDVRPLSNTRPSARAPPQKRKKTTGTSAEPKTTSTSTSTSERNEATSPPKDGIPFPAPAATSKSAQSTVTPSQPSAPLYPTKPSSNNASLSQPAVAPDTTMKKRKSDVLDATKVSAVFLKFAIDPASLTQKAFRTPSSTLIPSQPWS